MTPQELMDKYYEVGFALDAIEITISHLNNINLRDLWDEEESEGAYQQFSKITTQLEMIRRFAEKARVDFQSLEMVIDEQRFRV